MALDKPYKDVPGTTIFDADQARKGYHLNQFSMSLMKPENRERYLADREAYLDEWPLSPVQRQAVLDFDLNAVHRRGRQHLLPEQDRRHARPELPADGRLDDRHVRGRLPRHDGRRRPPPRGQPPEGPRRLDAARADGEKSEVDAPGRAGEVHVGAVHLARAGDRCGDGPRQDRGAVLEEGLRRLRVDAQVGEGEHARRRHPRLQRPRHRVRLVHHPDLRAGHGRALSGRRRGLRSPTRARRQGLPRAGRAHRPVGDPGRLRPHARQRDGRRPRPHGAAVARVRRRRGVAVQGHPARGQRRAVPGAVRSPLLRTRAGRSAARSTSGTASRSTCRSGAPAA